MKAKQGDRRKMGDGVRAGSEEQNLPGGTPASSVYRAVGRSPGENLRAVLEMAGGAGSIVGPDDVVVIKPNAQWWNHGGVNLAALEALVEAVMERPGGFRGDVVIAENCHRGRRPWTRPRTGWAGDYRWNSDLAGVGNLNELCRRLKERHGESFSTVHWINTEAGGRRVASPGDGEGYVICDGTGGAPLLECGNGLEGERERRTVMTYPIFRTDSGRIVDFRNGVWEEGGYSARPLRFVNVAALNHHGLYCGPTSAVKNYLGVTDLSGGPDPFRGGKLTEEHFNFHAFAFDGHVPGPVPGMLGRAVGTFMKTVRKADLNITTAEWTGLISREYPPLAHTRAILACRDPVALDRHAARYVLYPNSRIGFHDPDDKGRPFYHDLTECAKAAGLAENGKDARVFNAGPGGRTGEGALEIMGGKRWGRKGKMVARYLRTRYLR
jgi:hypothetical protein